MNYTLTQLHSGTTYTARIFAKNLLGQSAIPDQETFTTLKVGKCMIQLHIKFSEWYTRSFISFIIRVHVLGII